MERHNRCHGIGGQDRNIPYMECFYLRLWNYIVRAQVLRCGGLPVGRGGASGLAFAFFDIVLAAFDVEAAWVGVEV